MDVLARASLLLVVAGGCVASEGDVFTSRETDGGLGGDGAPGDAARDGDGEACPAMPACPPPPLGDVTVCGTVVDISTSQPITADAPDVRVFDLLELRLNPFEAAELARVSPDSCGHFQTTVDGTLGLFGVQTGEFPGEPPGDFRGVAQAITAAPGNAARVTAWALPAAVDDQWSSDAGINGTFSGAGSIMAIFVDVTEPATPPLQGAPVAGVTMTINGAPMTGSDYYFDDTDPLLRTSVAPAQDQSGTNGSGLVRSPGQASSHGGDKSGCDFNQEQSVSVPGMLQVQEITGTCN